MDIESRRRSRRPVGIWIILVFTYITGFVCATMFAGSLAVLLMDGNQRTESIIIDDRPATPLEMIYVITPFAALTVATAELIRRRKHAGQFLAVASWWIMPVLFYFPAESLRPLSTADFAGPLLWSLVAYIYFYHVPAVRHYFAKDAESLSEP